MLQFNMKVFDQNPICDLHTFLSLVEIKLQPREWYCLLVKCRKDLIFYDSMSFNLWYFLRKNLQNYEKFSKENEVITWTINI